MAKGLSLPFRSYMALLPFFLIGLASCSDDKEVFTEEETTIEGDYVEPTLWTSNERIIAPAWISPSVPEPFAAALRTRISNEAGSADEAQLIVTDMQGYSANKLPDGKIAIVYDPSDVLVATLGENGGDDDALCVGIQERGGHFIVNEPEDDGDMPASLNSIVSWANASSQSADNGFEKDDDSYGASYSGEIDNTICKVALSKPDRLKGKYDVSIRADVTPLHGFESGRNKAMDYYIVTLTTTVQSKGMYSGNFTKKHGGVRARICGYYLKNLSIDASITDPKGKAADGTFFQSVPTPATTQGATSYTTSSGFNFSGGISYGTNITNSKFGYTHSSTESRTISDCEIINNHDNDVAKFQYKINNLPSYNTHIRINTPPDIAVSTATFYNQWIWAVPTKDNDESTEYKLKINLHDFIYGASYFYSSKADYHNLDFKIADAEVTLKLRKPVRYPVGSVKIDNDIKDCYLTYAVYEGKKKIEEKGNQYRYKDTCVTYLPVGEYILKCKMKGKDSASAKKECEYIYEDKIKVLMGETIVKATSDGKFIIK